MRNMLTRALLIATLFVLGRPVAAQTGWFDPVARAQAAQARRLAAANSVALAAKADSTTVDGVAVQAITFVPIAERAAIRAGTSTYDATAAIQAAIDSGASQVFVDNGRWNVGNIVIQNKSGFTFTCRGGAVLAFSGTAPSSGGNFTTKIGIQLAGVLDRVRVTGCREVMSQALTDGHAGVWSNSGGTFSNIEIDHMETVDGINGISVNTNLSGTQTGVYIHHNRVITPRGTDSGYGYGIHVADGSGLPVLVLIEYNYIQEAERHSIYFARGLNGRIQFNTIVRHRLNQKTGQFRAAINLIRSSNVVVNDNYFENCSDGALYLGQSAANGDNLQAYNNRYVVTATANNVPQIIVGSIDPTVLNTDTTPNAADGSPTHVIIRDERFEVDGNDADLIRMNNARGLRVSNIRGWRKNVNGQAQVIDLRAAGGDIWNSDLSLLDINVDQDRSGTSTGTQARIRIESAVAGGTWGLRLERVNGRADQTFAGSTAIDDPNVSIYDMGFASSAFATGVYPFGRFWTTYDVANFDPPSLTAGTAARTNVSVPGVKVGDMVALSFNNSTSLVAFSGQVNANNNINALMDNRGTGTTDLSAATLKVFIWANR